MSNNEWEDGVTQQPSSHFYRCFLWWQEWIHSLFLYCRKTLHSLQSVTLKTDITDASENRLPCCQQITEIEGCLQTLLELALQQHFYYKHHFPRAFYPAVKSLIQDQILEVWGKRKIQSFFMNEIKYNWMYKL